VDRRDVPVHHLAHGQRHAASLVVPPAGPRAAPWAGSCPRGYTRLARAGPKTLTRPPARVPARAQGHPLLPSREGARSY
jgi:hypothetical protein